MTVTVTLFAAPERLNAPSAEPAALAMSLSPEIATCLPTSDAARPICEVVLAAVISATLVFRLSMPSTVEICANSPASAVGSAGEVGVWYCSCAVSSCRKSDCVRLAAEPLPLDEAWLVPLLAVVDAAVVNC